MNEGYEVTDSREKLKISKPAINQNGPGGSLPLSPFCIFFGRKLRRALTLLSILLLKNTFLRTLIFLVETKCFAFHGFSEETGDYAILGIAGIRYITYRQAHPAPSPVLVATPVQRSFPAYSPSRSSRLRPSISAAIAKNASISCGSKWLPAPWRSMSKLVSWEYASLYTRLEHRASYTSATATIRAA